MPVTDHLVWSEIRDFSPGLWTASPHLMPASAAQRMENCCPQPGGGLRAFFRTTPAGLSNVGLPAGKTARGINLAFIIQQPATKTVLTSNALVMVSDTAAPSQGYALYELDRSVSTGAGWVLRKAFANGTVGADVHYSTFFTGHYNGAQGDLVAFTLNQPPGGSSDQGLWWVKLMQSGTPTKISADTGIVVSHQARLVVGVGNTLKWTDPDGLALTNTLRIAAGQAGARISWLLPVAPSDLFVGMIGGQLFNIQGDIGAGYVVREMGRFQANAFVQMPVFTPYGIVLIAGWDGIYLLSTSGQAQHISRGLDSSLWAPDPVDSLSMGRSAFYRDCTYFPHGVVYDHLTQSWFALPDLANCAYLSLDATMNQEKIVGATAASPPTFPTVQFSGGATRARDYTWKSAPIRDPGGRQIAIAEIQLVVQAYGSDETLDVSVGGLTHSVNLRSAGRHGPRFSFREHGAELDVTIRSRSAGATEAPTIEAVRIGTRPGHLLPIGATLQTTNVGRWDVPGSNWDQAYWS